MNSPEQISPEMNFSNEIGLWASSLMTGRQLPTKVYINLFNGIYEYTNDIECFACGSKIQ